MRKLLIIVLLFPSITLAEAAYVDIEWEPTESPIDGYKVYYGTTSGEYIHCIDVGKTTSYQIDGLLLIRAGHFQAVSQTLETFSIHLLFQHFYLILDRLSEKSTGFNTKRIID